MARKKIGLIVCIGFICVVIGNILFLNQKIKSVVLHELQTIFQTNVAIGSARLSFIPFGISITDLNVVDVKNPDLFQLESPKVTLALQISELFKGRFIVDELTISAVNLLGHQHRLVNKKSQQAIQLDQIDMAVIDPDQDYEFSHMGDSVFTHLLADTQLSGKKQSLALMEQLNLDESELANYLSLSMDRESLDVMNDKVVLLKESLDKMDLDSVDTLRNDVLVLKEQATQLKQNFVTKKEHIQSLYQARNSSVEGLGSYFDDDYQRLQQRIKVDSYQYGNLSDAFIGDMFSDYVDVYSYYAQFAARIINNLSDRDSVTNKKTSVSSSEKILPRIWIKKLLLTDVNDDFSVRILHLSSNQSLLDTPIRFQFFDSQKQIFASYFVGNVLTQVYSIKYLPFSLKSYSLYNDSHSQVMLDSATQDIAANFEFVGRRLAGNIYFNTTSINVSGNHLDRLSLAGLMYDTLDDNDNVVIKGELSGSITSPVVAISSDFDVVVKDRFNTAMILERNRQLQLLKQAITLRMELEKSMLLSTIDYHYNAWVADLDIELDRVGNLVASIEDVDQDSVVAHEKLLDIQRLALEKKQREDAIALELEKQKQAEALALEQAKQAAMLSLDNDDKAVEDASHSNSSDLDVSSEVQQEDSAFIVEEENQNITVELTQN